MAVVADVAAASALFRGPAVGTNKISVNRHVSIMQFFGTCSCAGGLGNRIGLDISRDVCIPAASPPSWAVCESFG